MPDHVQTPLAERDAADETAPEAVGIGSFTGRKQTVLLRPVPRVAPTGVPFFVFAAADGMPELAESLAAGTCRSEGAHRIAVVARDARTGEKLRARAIAQLRDSVAPSGPGIHYGAARQPGELALMFPGHGSFVPGTRQGLLDHFPEIVDRCATRYGGPFRDGLSLLTAEVPLGAAARVHATVVLSIVNAELLRRVLGVHVDAHMGLSLGEATMLVSAGAWRSFDTVFYGLEADGFFAGFGEDYRFVRHVLGEGGQRWSGLDLYGPVGSVEPLVAGIDGLWLEIVYSPSHCLVGGQPDACRALQTRLPHGILAVEQRQAFAFHGPFATTYREPYRRHHTVTCEAHADEPRFYFNAAHQAVVPEAHRVAELITEQAMNRLEFPPTVLRAWEDGVRVFIDVGPRSVLSRSVSEILGERPHVAIGLDQGGRHGLLRLAHVCGALFAYGMPCAIGGLARRFARWRGDDGAGAGAPRLTVAAHLPEVAPSPLEAVPPAAGPDTTIALPEPAGHGRLAAPWVMVGPDAPGRTIEVEIGGRAFVTRLVDTSLGAAPDAAPRRSKAGGRPQVAVPMEALPPTGPAFDRSDLERLASGRISDVFGPAFRNQDGYRRQCRMPQQPLLLADRVLGIAGEPGGMGKGVCWTETDVVDGAWYLDRGRMPIGIFIESGQADLLLISWLGVDAFNRGERVYRLLGCELTVHDNDLPRVGETIRYQIHIDGHANLGDTRLFFFRSDAWIGDRLISSVRNGQAGFFSDVELARSAGVLWSPEDETPAADARLDVPPRVTTRCTFDVESVRAFAAGRVSACFGPGFEPADAHQETPRFGLGRKQLIERVTAFDPQGGPWGRGYLKAEYDVPVDAWFYDGHFLNDECMPGNLMVEGATQAVSFLMAAYGFTISRDGWRFAPTEGEPFAFVCRGQVVPDSPHRLTYEIFVEEVIDGDRPTVFAAVLGCSDGFKVFFCRRFGISLRPSWPLYERPLGRALAEPLHVIDERHGIRGDYGALLACAWGRPSHAFGEFGTKGNMPGVLPRLPGPPYHFVSQVREVNVAAGEPRPGATLISTYDVAPDAWYFRESGNGVMPFSVLTEIALQPCGWMAIYLGFAKKPGMRFRNLDGKGVVVHREVKRDTGTLAVEVVYTSHATAGTISVVNFDVVCSDADGPVIRFATVFGFFTPEALANQTGLPTSPQAREQLAALADVSGTAPVPADQPCLPGGRLSLVDDIVVFDRDGGRAGLGRGVGRQRIVSSAWYFKAHFFEDPVQAGSFGLEALFTLFKETVRRKGLASGFASPVFEAPAIGPEFSWKYRGQVIPTNREVITEIELTDISEEGGTVQVRASGSLWVDGLRIYEVNDYTLRICEQGPSAFDGSRARIRLSVREQPCLRDHRPGHVIAVYPMMGVAGLAMGQFGHLVPGRGALEVRNLELRGWWTVDPELDVTADAELWPDDRVRVTFRRRSKDGSCGAVAGTAVLCRVATGGARVAWDEPAGAEAIRDPYELGWLFHGPAFRHARKLVAAKGISAFEVELEEAWAAADGEPTVVLDTLVHGVPYHRPDLWFHDVAAQQFAFPYRLESLRLYAPLPSSGTFRVISRELDKPTSRTIRFALQARCGGAVVAEAEIVLCLFANPFSEQIVANKRDAFLKGERAAGCLALCRRGETGNTRLSMADYRAASWLPGAIEAVFGVSQEARGDERRIVEEIAVKDHLASRRGLHPRQVRVEGAMLRLPGGAWHRLDSLTHRWIDDAEIEIEGDLPSDGKAP